MSRKIQTGYQILSSANIKHYTGMSKGARQGGIPPPPDFGSALTARPPIFLAPMLYVVTHPPDFQTLRHACYKVLDLD
jgi:hypothetical protein